MVDNKKVKEILEALQNEDADKKVNFNEARSLREINRDIGEAINVMARSANAMNILEVGTGRGYFTIWLALAARGHGGKVTTYSTQNQDEAKKNIDESGLGDYVEFISASVAEASAILPQNVDLVYVNATPTEAETLAPILVSNVRHGGCIISDKIMTHTLEMKGYIDTVRSNEHTSSVMFPLGRGLEVTYKLEEEELSGAELYVKEDVENVLKQMHTEDQQQRENDLPREKRWRSVSSDIGKAISVLSRMTNAINIVEIGTSQGYSTTWLAAAAAAQGGTVTTFEIEEWRQEKAKENLQKAGLSDYVEFILVDPKENTDKIPDNIDFVFIDAEKDDYLDHFKAVYDKLRPGGTVVADNALSHFAELRSYITHAHMSKSTNSILIPLDRGLEVTYKFEDEEKRDADLFYDLIR